MKKFKVSVPCDYIAGYLKYGHSEMTIEAETLEEAKELAKEYEDYDLILDDYSVEDIGEFDFDNMIIEEVTE